MGSFHGISREIQGIHGIFMGCLMDVSGF